MKIRYLISVLTITLMMPGLADAQAERKYIRQGNRQYNDFISDTTHSDSTLLIKAEESYRKALEEDPNNWDASYNLANTLFRQNRLDEASRQYQALGAKTDVDKMKRAAAYHNLGNCLLQGNNLQGAIEAYKDALRNNPGDLNTKYNLAWAQDKLKQQQQNEQQQNQDQNKQDQDQEQNQDQNQDQQQSQDQQNQDQQNQDQQKQDQQQNQEQQQENQQQQHQDQNDEQQMSKDDAMRILEALENDEKDVQEKVQKQKAQPQKRRTQKDW